jgi:SSS family solute:Na+ symporter
VTWLTPPEPDATLHAFYRRVRPHGRGWTPIAAAVGLPPASGSLGAELLNAFLGCVLVYSALFGVGELLLRSAAIGIGLLVVSALAACAIARNLTAEERAVRSASNLSSTS